MENNTNIMTYPEVAEVLGVAVKSVSQFLTKHNVRKGKVLRKGRSIGVADRHSLMMVVDRLNYTGPIDANDVVWAS